MKKLSIIIYLLLFCSFYGQAVEVLVEAENFTNKGGWFLDQQFMDQMGSPFLMAHGLGKPVNDATTSIKFPKNGTYYMFVRTRNWVGYWSDKGCPGIFNVLINDKPINCIFGNQNTEWSWQNGGSVRINNSNVKISLHDLTGFNGRCDAIIFSTDAKFRPENSIKELALFRKKALHLSEKPVSAGKFDLVVVGGGMAGTCTAISAARQGLKVALIQDRPVLGGNNSSEVRVHLGGRINLKPYPSLGNLVNEIGPTKEGNAEPASNYDDQKKLDAVLVEKNISLFLNYRANEVEKKDNLIKAVIASNIGNSKELRFEAPLFADCTGDATIGALAGADFMRGKEAKSEFNEATAPEVRENNTMGSSVQWNSIESPVTTNFPDITWGLKFNEKKVQVLKKGDWDWETGMKYDQVKDFERVRDYGLLVIFSNWSFLKNHYSGTLNFNNSQLNWVAYIGGKRESRRLIGDLILTENDITTPIGYKDGTASSSWTIDLHYPDPINTQFFPGEEFISIAKHIKVYTYPIPYRCLYSRNINNLFMAGRNISVTHVALGTVRVMRTTGMMGEVLGMAASICNKHGVLPRKVYEDYLTELQSLMNKGVGRSDIPNKQKYNEGSTLTIDK